MSFDLFLQRFRDGAKASFARAIFDEVFPPERRVPDPRFRFVRINYPDGSGADVYGYGDPIRSLMFNHFGGDEFFDDVVRLAHRSQSVLVWPSELFTLAYTDESVLEHLPSDLSSDAVKRLVRDGRELGHVMQGRRLDER